MMDRVLRFLCVMGVFLAVAGGKAQTAKPTVGVEGSTSGQAGQANNAKNSTNQPPGKRAVPPSLQQTIEHLQSFWSTQFDQIKDFTSLKGTPQGPLTFTISNTLPNLQVSYRFPGDLRSTKFYPRADGKPGVVQLAPNQNIFLIQFSACGDKVPCLGPNIDQPDAKTPTDNDCPETHLITDSTSSVDPCTVDLVFVRDLYAKDAAGNINLRPAFVITKNGFAVSEALIKMSKTGGTIPTFVINKLTLQQYFGDDSLGLVDSGSYALPGASTDPEPMSLISGWASVRDFEFERFPPDTSCLPYAQTAELLEVSRPNYIPVKLGKDNGIALYPPKVFDVFTLRQMLATTAAQLSGLAGFSQASINGAFGNLQGVTTDTSYLSAQVTTVATPSVVSQAVNGNTGSNVFGNSSGTTGLGTTSNSTLTCPAGTLPGIGTAGLPACVAVVTAASGTGGNPVGFTGANNLNGGISTLNGGTTSNGTTSNNSNTNTQNTNQQNTTTTTSGGQAGTVAPIPVSNVPTAPTNIGVASQDILAEQVQLNSQITTLRMALQGALSDQYLVAAGKTLGNRQQTTLGINISLDPPSRYKHAVAEVRIWVYAMGGKPVSIVNLLPTAKTYNVAKITSNQKAFGAGVVLDPVNVGAAAGKTKNRLFLAKDTDTVALEYPADRSGRKADDWPNGADPVERSVQEHLQDAVRETEIWQSIGDACVENPGPLPGNSKRQANPVIFGWQFRPVLGADYVQSGLRQVFAQLALPGSVAQGQLLAPKVYIQTRWREYNEKEQVVGPVYKGSCSITEDTDPITVASPLKVRRAYFDDMGGGIVKVKAEGTFYASGFTAMSGPTTLSPTTFDGASIQFFSSASNLILTDDLKLVSEDGMTTELGVKPNGGKSCGIQSATLSAIPRPDGNSWVEMQVKAGADYKIDADGPLHPLILVGTAVFGLHETPFYEDVKEACASAPMTCTYHFLAPTSVLRSAQTYTFRDLSWTNMKKSGKIDFDPSFSGLTTLGPDSSGSASDAGQATAKIQPVYTLNGNDLTNLAANLNCKEPKCFEVFQGFTRLTLTKENFDVASPTTAILRFGPQSPEPTISVDKVGAATLIALSATDQGAGETVAPAGFTVSNPQPPAHPKPIVKAVKAPGAGGKGSKVIKDQSAAQSMILYTTNGTAPTISQDKGIAAPTAIYQSPIDPTQFADHATTMVEAIAIGANQLPSEVAVAKFYRNGSLLLPLYTQPSSPSSYNSYRFVWHPGATKADAVEWDLSVPPKAPKTAVAASTILNAGDSTEVDFSGVEVLANSVTTPITFTYDNTLVPNALFSYDATKKSLRLMITTAMTAKPGHKEVVMNAFVKGTDGTGKATQVILPFDVTKR